MTKSFFSIGIDPSTKTGVALLRADPNTDDITLVKSAVVKGQGTGVTRATNLALQIFELMRPYCFPETPKENCILIIEGYGFVRPQHAAVLVEVGTMIRYFFYKSGNALLAVPPTSLKKFVTGKGNCPKDVVIKEVYKRWGFDTDSNDVADAIGLAMFGLASKKLIKMPKINMTAVHNVLDK